MTKPTAEMLETIQRLQSWHNQVVGLGLLIPDLTIFVEMAKDEEARTSRLAALDSAIVESQKRFDDVRKRADEAEVRANVTMRNAQEVADLATVKAATVMRAAENNASAAEKDANVRIAQAETRAKQRLATLDEQIMVAEQRLADVQREVDALLARLSGR